MLAKFMSKDYAQHVADQRLLRDEYTKRIKSASSKEEQKDLKEELGRKLKAMTDAYDEKHK